MLKRAATYTLGCKVNQTETETIEGLLQDHGYEIVDFEEIADIYLINTCTVTSQADRKSRQIIRRAQSLGKSRDAVLIVMGCYAQVSAEKILEELGVDLIIGNSQRFFFMDHLNKFLADRIPAAYVDDIMKEKDFEEIKTRRNISRTRAFLKIQEGCQQFCSYCIIPYTRGPLRSKKIEDTIEEIKGLEDAGFKELVLTGIHTGSYGKDFGDAYKLENLLADILKATHTIRLRISSIEPTEVTEELAKLIAKEERLCSHLHIPLQSGHDYILKKMKRPYDTKYFREKLAMIRHYNSDISITTDIMVGFPYETEEHAQATLLFAQEMAFADIHVFKYSPRANTPASLFPEQVPGKEKDRRSRALISLTKKLKEEYMKKFIGRELEVLIEQQEGQYASGHTSNYLKVLIEGQAVKNQTKKVYIEKAEEDFLIGR